MGNNVWERKKGAPAVPGAGRKKGSSAMSDRLKDMLNHNINYLDPIEGEPTRKQIKEHINMTLIKKALDGDLKAIQEIYDRTEGKPINMNQYLDKEGKPMDSVPTFVVNFSQPEKEKEEKFIEHKESNELEHNVEEVSDDKVVK